MRNKPEKQQSETEGKRREERNHQCSTRLMLESDTDQRLKHLQPRHTASFECPHESSLTGICSQGKRQNVELVVTEPVSVTLFPKRTTFST